MYKEIEGNKRKTFLLITIFLIAIIFLGWAFSYIYGSQIILWAAVFIAFFHSWFSYYHSDKIAIAVSRAREVKREKEIELHRIVENLSIAAGVPKPRVYVIEDDSLNAFATGRDYKHSAIAVTRGLLNRLEKSELEGVISHELSHIKNYDILVMTVTVVLVGVIVLMSDFFIRSLWWGGRRRSEGQGGNILMIVGIVLAILAPIFARLIQLAVSRKREYLADASGALLTRYPEGLAKALEKIGNAKPMRFANRATAHLFIANPFSAKKVSGLFATHPPMAERIKKLRSMGV